MGQMLQRKCGKNVVPRLCRAPSFEEGQLVLRHDALDRDDRQAERIQFVEYAHQGRLVADLTQQHRHFVAFKRRAHGRSGQDVHARHLINPYRVWHALHTNPADEWIVEGNGLR